MSPADGCACVVCDGITAPTTVDAVALREVAERVVVGDELALGARHARDARCDARVERAAAARR